MSKKKKMYNRWKLLNERAILMEKCRRIGQVMGQINLTIKSVADNALLLSYQPTLHRTPQMSLLNILFNKFISNVKDSFAKLRTNSL